MSLARRIRAWAGGVGLWRKMAVALAAAALGSGIATYLALTGAPPFGPGPRAVLILLQLDLVLLLALACWVAKRLVEVWLERRRGLAGSRLQVRLVGLFSLIAVTPTIIVAIFSYLFFSFGVESWFSDKVRTAISELVAVADAYVQGTSAGDPRRCARDGGRPRPLCRIAAAEPAISRAGPDGAGGDARPDRGGDPRPQGNDAGAHRSRVRPRVRGCQPGRACGARSRARSSS